MPSFLRLQARVCELSWKSPLCCFFLAPLVGPRIIHRPWEGERVNGWACTFLCHEVYSLQYSLDGSCFGLPARASCLRYWARQHHPSPSRVHRLTPLHSERPTHDRPKPAQTTHRPEERLIADSSPIWLYCSNLLSEIEPPKNIAQNARYLPANFQTQPSETSNPSNQDHSETLAAGGVPCISIHECEGLTARFDKQSDVVDDTQETGQELYGPPLLEVEAEPEKEVNA